MKRAQVSPQAGSNVAVFIFLLALFLALYILLIPPEDREKLLQENLTKNGVNAEETERVNILEQSPGQLKISNEDAIIHKIDSINLYSKEEPKVTDLASSVPASFNGDSPSK